MKSHVRLVKQQEGDQQHSGKSGVKENKERVSAPGKSDPRLLLSAIGKMGIEEILLLQKTAGNRAVATSLTHPIQASLKVTSPNDPAELEAEKIAAAVMEMTDQGEKIPRAMHQADGGGDSIPVAKSIEREVAGLEGTGNSLPENEREFFESRMGYDFGSVRIHIGGKAEKLTKSLQARAFTYGSYIAFGPGEYRPGTPEGRRLLAHELAHVVQQGKATPLSLKRDEVNARHSQLIVARQEESGATRTNPLFTLITGEEAGRRLVEPPKKEKPKEKLYNITFLGKTYTNLTKLEAISMIRRAATYIKINIDAGMEGHRYLKKVHDDQWIVSWISDTVGRVKMPPMTIWNVPLKYYIAGMRALDAGNIPAATRNLARADEEAVRCRRILYEYREGTISGANITVTGLRVVETAGAVAAGAAVTLATAGAGWSLLATAGMGALTSGAYGAAQETAEQSGAIAVGMQKSFDISKILKRGLKDAIAGFIGGVVGGALTARFMRAMGPYIGETISDAELTAMGITREEFMTASQKIGAKVLGDVGVAPLTTATNLVFDLIAKGKIKPHSMDELITIVAKEAAKAGLATLIKESVIEAMEK